MDTARSQQAISDDATETAEDDGQGGRPDSPGQVEHRSSRGRKLPKRIALVLGLGVLVVVVSVAAWLAPPVLDRDFPQPLAESLLYEPTGYVDVGGIELPYLEEGTGPPVLLIHGGGSGLHEFDALVEVLAEDHRVISYSRRGYEGAGEPVTEDDPLPYVDAAAILEGLDAEGAIVAGHSSGAGMAARLARERPELVGGVVALDPALDEDIPLGFIRVVLAREVRSWFTSNERAAVPILRWLAQHDDGYNPWDEDPAFTDDVKHRILRAGEAPLADLDAQDAAGVDFFPREGLDALDLPITLVVGEQSRPHYHRAIDTLAEEIPDATRIDIPDTGHVMQIENPAGVADAIRQTAQAALADE